MRCRGLYLSPVGVMPWLITLCRIWSLQVLFLSINLSIPSKSVNIDLASVKSQKEKELLLEANRILGLSYSRNSSNLSLQAPPVRYPSWPPDSMWPFEQMIRPRRISHDPYGFFKFRFKNPGPVSDFDRICFATIALHDFSQETLTGPWPRSTSRQYPSRPQAPKWLTIHAEFFNSPRFDNERVSRALLAMCSDDPRDPGFAHGRWTRDMDIDAAYLVNGVWVLAGIISIRFMPPPPHAPKLLPKMPFKIHFPVHMGKGQDNGLEFRPNPESTAPVPHWPRYGRQDLAEVIQRYMDRVEVCPQSHQLTPEWRTVTITTPWTSIIFHFQAIRPDFTFQQLSQVMETFKEVVQRHGAFRTIATIRDNHAVYGHISM